MQSTEDWLRDNLFCSVKLIRLSWAVDMLPDSLVRSTVVEVGLEILDGRMEVALAADEAKVKAPSADTAQEPFANRVGFGLSWPKMHIRSNAHRSGGITLSGYRGRQAKSWMDDVFRPGHLSRVSSDFFWPSGISF
jgi:hypothetical protein